MRSRKLADFFKLMAFLACLAFGTALLAKFNAREIVGQARILDGDSLIVSGVEIRLLGIDAPEYNQECTGPGSSEKFLCGRESITFLRQLVRSRPVQCKGFETDKYDRLLADCVVNGLEINKEMVRSGWAVSYGYYEAEQEIARKSRIGLWQGEFELPKNWRRAETERHSKGWLGWVASW